MTVPGPWKNPGEPEVLTTSGSYLNCVVKQRRWPEKERGDGGWGVKGSCPKNSHWKFKLATKRKGVGSKLEKAVCFDPKAFVQSAC